MFVRHGRPIRSHASSFPRSRASSFPRSRASSFPRSAWECIRKHDHTQSRYGFPRGSMGTREKTFPRSRPRSHAPTRSRSHAPRGNAYGSTTTPKAGMDSHAGAWEPENTPSLPRSRVGMPMGSVRFILASLVLLSHLGISIAGLNPGVIAVVAFYLLAGHVVAGLWAKWQRQPKALFNFYRDRSWRIVPQYSIAAIFAALLWHNGAQSPFISAAPALTDWLANTLIIPLNYYMYTGQDSFTLIPPAWSLATEIQFYLIAPLLLSQRLSRLIICLALSLVIFALAQSQWLNTDYYGYRLLPGILFIFILGALQQLSSRHKSLPRLLLAIWLLNAAYLLWLIIGQAHIPYNREVSLGLLLAMPLLAALSKKKSPQAHAPADPRSHAPTRPRSHAPRGNAYTPPKAGTDSHAGAWQPDQSQSGFPRWSMGTRKAASRLDKNLGALSYGVFLYHFPVIWLLQLQPPVAAAQDIASVAVLTIGCAALGHGCVERPLWRRFRPLKKPS